jgi:hypothetical protein
VGGQEGRGNEEKGKGAKEVVRLLVVGVGCEETGARTVPLRIPPCVLRPPWCLVPLGSQFQQCGALRPLCPLSSCCGARQPLRPVATPVV